MVTYKLIKNYPQFEMPLECRSVADGGYYTNKGDRVYNPEDYPEFWQEVVKKDYKVLSFELNKKIFKLNENKNKYFAEDGNYANYVEMLNDNRIISIRRLSDGEIFTIGDKLEHNMVIESFKFENFGNGEKLTAQDKNGGRFLNELKKVKQKLFTTEDGVDIFKGDLVVCFDKDSFCIRNKTYLFKEHDKNDKTYLFFSTKEKAQEWVVLNKPCLSIKEICPIIGQCNNTTYIDLDKLTEKLKELVKSKL